ncbi:D-tyrosyl-tRNA(tyr) deacylase Dtd [Thermacetogenium phaeum DSM 12270]|uniref:D-aminoacyl-tRNA deacylase n=2 Tax=Thermacetogenium phaeum TaxID=85874 RepID=K4LF43_THEPS|nr:D-aminoacyl-tRNA deacylase [Thermacetogenium phaeum]AFV11468.1 D-tyrosyl-tRNA(tyr) deacylase Dtd [Thermacetogenium phaeum DSM 12270]KUK36902.1 MAG: D-tyrosyl-tRNA(Tyr) deacylase [Thermacetogenium phaeum]MDN5365266.1 D-aminoacyl-tRNA deacylase [Thermacetogenium sp.]
MRAVVQRVSRGWVQIEGKERRSIGTGLVILVGVGKDDSSEDARYLAEKILNLRIFPDGEGKFNYSVCDMGGDLLVVSQFTLYGDCRKGRRPSFTEAAAPEEASPLLEMLLRYLGESGLNLVTGEFRTKMEVGIINDGPVTILLDSKKRF